MFVELIIFRDDVIFLTFLVLLPHWVAAFVVSVT